MEPKADCNGLRRYIEAEVSSLRAETISSYIAARWSGSTYSLRHLLFRRRIVCSGALQRCWVRVASMPFAACSSVSLASRSPF